MKVKTVRVSYDVHIEEHTFIKKKICTTFNNLMKVKQRI